MNESLRLNCPECGVRACCAEPGAKTPPPFCPMPVEKETLEEVERAYLQDENLHTLAVDPAHRNRRIGTRMIQRALAVLAESGIPELHLWRNDDSRAAPLYARLGFRPTGRVE